ncbi:hypothetical protein KC315_g8999 [Hortaea werneckii]|nr:hypothetical protein KC315_g8999 [Hortaea werneckii]KAI7363000.1 hypothetical protein KC354_g6848 [Hortaea werneckii]
MQGLTLLQASASPHRKLSVGFSLRPISTVQSILTDLLSSTLHCVADDAMGDPFSIAVGALQVAEVGFKLCDTLHSSVRDFKNAEKDVKRVASEVKTASWALKQLGALLQQDEAIKRTKPGAISEASTALDQCNEAFAEVQVILPAGGSGSTTSVSAATRFKWATRKSRVEALLANLERLKTTLVLVFKVISYAKEIASCPEDFAMERMDMRFQLETLIKSKDEAVRKYEQLVKSLDQTRLDDDSTDALRLDSGSQSLNAGAQQQHAQVQQAQVEQIEEQEKKQAVPKLSMSQTQGQESASLTGSAQMLMIEPVAASSYQTMPDRWGENVAKPLAMNKRSASDGGHRSARILDHKRSGSRAGDLKDPRFQVNLPREHYSRRLKMERIPCQFCSLGFNRGANLRSHEQTHTEEKPFLCPVCEEGFVDKFERNGHRALHGDQKTYVCKGTLVSDEVWGCGGRYASPEEFYRHIRLEGRVCIQPLWEEEIAMKREDYKRENARKQQDLQANVTNVETEFPKTEQVLPTTDHELPLRVRALFPALASIADTSYDSNSLSPSKDGARNDDVDIENDTDEGQSGKLTQEERDFLQSQMEQSQPRKRKANPGEAREQRAAKNPAKKRARDLGAKAAAGGLSGDDMESDTSRDRKRPLGEKEVRLLIGAYERDHGEPSTSSHRKTDGNVSVSTADVPSANDGVTPGRLCNSQKEELHLPPLTLPNPPAKRKPALKMQVPGSHLPTREDVDLKLTQFSYEKPEDFEKPIDADTEDPVDALLREWTTIQVC